MWEGVNLTDLERSQSILACLATKNVGAHLEKSCKPRNFNLEAHCKINHFMNAKQLIQKIQNTLNIGVLSYFKSSSSGNVREHLVSLLGLRKHSEHNSAYPVNKYMLTTNGETLTIRLSDHPANEKNFIAKYNVSIIIGKKADEITIESTKYSNIYSEVVYRSECFSDGCELLSICIFELSINNACVRWFRVQFVVNCFQFVFLSYR